MVNVRFVERHNGWENVINWLNYAYGWEFMDELILIFEVVKLLHLDRKHEEDFSDFIEYISKLCIDRKVCAQALAASNCVYSRELFGSEDEVYENNGSDDDLSEYDSDDELPRYCYQDEAWGIESPEIRFETFRFDGQLIPVRRNLAPNANRGRK